MKRWITMCLAVALATSAVVGLSSCSWDSLTHAGIDLSGASHDEYGYIRRSDIKKAVLESEQLVEAECFTMALALDESKDPATYVMDFSSAGNSYHYVLDAKTGELIDKLVYSL